MLSKLFIRRPRLSIVISTVLVIAGLASMMSLPTAQYPDITPPQIQIASRYTGAGASVAMDTVVIPLESQVNGVKDMLYMSSSAANDGTATTTVTFRSGSDPDMDTVNTQNRVSLATSQLPDEVRRDGVTVKQKSSNILMVVSLISPKGTKDELFLNNYAAINVTGELQRIPGVAEAKPFGSMDYSMRIWLEPDRMASLGLSPQDVISAIQSQNVQAAAGQIGQPPTPSGQSSQILIQVKGRLSSAEEFDRVIVRALPDGSSIRVGDVARVELGSIDYSVVSEVDGRPGVNLAVYQLPDANGISIAESIHAKMRELSAHFPEDVQYSVLFDTTQFVRASIDEVITTLFEAVLIVILVVFLFLQDWRSTIIPTVAVPVSLIGTFAAMLAFGYSINLVTLFGLILAIGIVVDDAILVVENTRRLMDDEGLPAAEAAEKTMEQVTGPVVATTLVLLAMFVPVCFLSGITGELYRQFAVTISVAVVISSINALTLSPALCACVLIPSTNGRRWLVFRIFNWMLSRTTSTFGMFAGILARKCLLGILLIGVCAAACGWLYPKIPTGFIPQEDMGVFFVAAQLPDGASLERTQRAVAKAKDAIASIDGVGHILSMAGLNLIDSVNESNSALLIVILKDWSERKAPSLSQDAILEETWKRLSAIPEAAMFAFPLPAIPGLGNTGGLSFVLEDLRGVSPKVFGQVLKGFITEANKQPELAGAFSTYRSSTPQIHLEVDREKAMKMGVGIDQVFSALQAYLGSYYVNDFNLFGKVYKVVVQAKGESRVRRDDILSLHVSNDGGAMVPLGTFATCKTVFGPQIMSRYNMYQSAVVNGTPAPGYSSGQAMAAMERAAAILPEGFKFEWTDMAYQERMAGGRVAIVFAMAIIFIYLFLVGQYEGWMIPAAVLLSIPVAFLGSLGFLFLWGQENNIYTQVGFVLLFGLACKTAILVVEFAKERREEAGESIVDAAMSAGVLRFRAVLMTALSFVLGVIPLVVATGAGSVSRQCLGTAVFGGMLVATILGTLLIPSFYVAIQKLVELVCGPPKNSK